MLCLSGFELYSRWVALNTNHLCKVILRHASSVHLKA